MYTLPPNHDLAHLTTALKSVQRRHLAVDGGAHRGIWTRKLLDAFEYVFAAEPYPPHYAELQRLVKEYPRRLVVWPGALGDGTGTGTLEPGPDNDGQGHLRPGASAGGVVIAPLDDFVDTFLASHVDFLKLDVEGYELLALQGASHLIQRDRPVVLIEENGLCERYGITRGAAGQWLLERGYRLHLRMNKDELYVPDVCQHLPLTPEGQYTKVRCARCGRHGSIPMPGGPIVWEEDV